MLMGSQWEMAAVLLQELTWTDDGLSLTPCCTLKSFLLRTGCCSKLIALRSSAICMATTSLTIALFTDATKLRMKVFWVGLKLDFSLRSSAPMSPRLTTAPVGSIRTVRNLIQLGSLSGTRWTFSILSLSKPACMARANNWKHSLTGETSPWLNSFLLRILTESHAIFFRLSSFTRCFCHSWKKTRGSNRPNLTCLGKKPPARNKRLISAKRTKNRVGLTKRRRLVSRSLGLKANRIRNEIDGSTRELKEQIRGHRLSLAFSWRTGETFSAKRTLKKGKSTLSRNQSI